MPISLSNSVLASSPGSQIFNLSMDRKESLVYTALPALHHFTEGSINLIASLVNFCDGVVDIIIFLHCQHVRSLVALCFVSSSQDLLTVLAYMAHRPYPRYSNSAELEGHRSASS